MQAIHTLAVDDSSDPLAMPDRVLYIKKTVANVIGGGAGSSVVTAVAIAGLPAAYNVVVTPNQDAVAFVSGKTQAGFNVTLFPRLAANTLAVGTFDLVVTA